MQRRVILHDVMDTPPIPPNITTDILQISMDILQIFSPRKKSLSEKFRQKEPHIFPTDNSSLPNHASKLAMAVLLIHVVLGFKS